MMADSSAGRRRKGFGLNSFFRGFYFKQQSMDHAFALIAANGRDENGNAFASIQAVLPDGTFSIPFPPECARIDSRGPFLRFGENHLSAEGLKVDLNGGGHSIQGALRFGPAQRPRGDIMGPFRFFPGMECRHHLVSMAHEVRGGITIDGRRYDCDGALGYIEGDSGRSFPTRYLWTHCFPENGAPRSVMLSVAEIPFCGLHFTGAIGFILLDGREIRLATYLGAKVLEFADGRAVLRQGGDTLEVQFNPTDTATLQAPVDGRMSRAIGERLLGRARYHFSRNGRTVFDFTSERASFECEYH